MPHEFDRFAQDYESVVSRTVRLSGEEAGYFARYKLARVQRLCGPFAPSHILDIGCGVGLLTELLGRAFRSSRVTGLECSGRSVERAASRVAGLSNVRVHAYDGTKLPEHISGVDLAILANVLHHIAPPGRQAFLHEVIRPALLPGGRVVVFEHNPYHPLTRCVVRRSPLDRDAHLLSRCAVTRLLAGAGFAVRQCEYIVFFPRILRALRILEPKLGWLPLGAQYQVVGHAAEAAG